MKKYNKPLSFSRLGRLRGDDYEPMSIFESNAHHSKFNLGLLVEDLVTKETSEICVYKNKITKGVKEYIEQLDEWSDEAFEATKWGKYKLATIKKKIIGHEDYFNFIQNCDKTVDQKTYDLAVEMSKKVGIYKSLCEGEFQYKLEFEYRGLKFIGYIDVLQTKDGKLRVIDIKTTYKKENFINSSIKYDYPGQLALYDYALRQQGYKTLPPVNLVIPIQGPAFVVTPTLSLDTIDLCIDRFLWHQENGWEKEGDIYVDKESLRSLRTI